MKNLTTQKDWDSLNRSDRPVQVIDKTEFDEIFLEHLSIGNNRVALEVGCVPGTFLAHICKRFGYFPEGIDYDKKTKSIFSRTMEKYGLSSFKVYQEDFFKWKTDKKYDLVCSFGFIEHFSNPEEVVKRHVDLTKSGGKVLVEIPNFSGFNKFLHQLVDKPSLDKHNISIMNLEFFRKLAEENNLKILYLGYYGSWHFQWGYGRRQTANIFQLGIYALLKLVSKITIHFPMRNKLSNYIVFIAEKK